MARVSLACAVIHMLADNEVKKYHCVDAASVVRKESSTGGQTHLVDSCLNIPGVCGCHGLQGYRMLTTDFDIANLHSVQLQSQQ